MGHEERRVSQGLHLQDQAFSLATYVSRDPTVMAPQQEVRQDIADGLAGPRNPEVSIRKRRRCGPTRIVRHQTQTMALRALVDSAEPEDYLTLLEILGLPALSGSLREEGGPEMSS